MSFFFHFVCDGAVTVLRPTCDIQPHVIHSNWMFGPICWHSTRTHHSLDVNFIQLSPKISNKYRDTKDARLHHIELPYRNEHTHTHTYMKSCSMFIPNRFQISKISNNQKINSICDQCLTVGLCAVWLAKITLESSTPISLPFFFRIHFVNFSSVSKAKLFHGIKTWPYAWFI